MKKITLLFLCFLITKAHAQDTTQNTQNSLSGLFDSVYDNNGNSYSINELAIDNNIRYKALRKRTNDTTQTEMVNISVCGTSYFRLFFDDGWYNGLDVTKESNARNVICQAFLDISNLIVSPLSANGKKVNIWVRNSGKMKLPSSVLGAAFSYHILPNYFNQNYTGGIVDNLIWQLINTGNDPFNNVILPLSNSNSYSQYGSDYFHGVISFNFNFNWNYRLDTMPKTTQYDLYSVVLHEIVHSLGFGSLISNNQNSIYGFHHYSKYDLQLRDSVGASLLNHTSTLPLYAYKSKYLAQLGNSTSDSTICSSAVKYHFNGGSVIKVPVYTPKKFEYGSSLSHFEDSCYCPTNVSNSCNDKYFVTSNTSKLGVLKRYFTKEERQVLCDIGYSTNSTFGSTPNLNFINYNTPSCLNNTTVWGSHDGVANGIFIYSDTLKATIKLQGNANPIANFLNNDATTANKFEGLEVVYGKGILNATTGNATTTITYKPDSIEGTHLLRYIPFDSITGKRGGITYIYVTVFKKDCPTSTPCNLVVNEGFETGTNASIPELSSCWYGISNFCAGTPDYIYAGVRDKRNWAYWQIHKYPTFKGCELTTPPTTPWNNPTVDTINNGNNAFIGLMTTRELMNGKTQWGEVETIKTRMVAQITPNTTYKLRFKAKVANYQTTRSGAHHTTKTWVFLNKDTRLTLAVNNDDIACRNYTSNYQGLTKPYILCNAIVPALNNWVTVDTVFTTSDTIPTSKFLYLINGFFTLYKNNPNDATTFSSYLMIDDIQLTTIESSLNIPKKSICVGDTIKDLRQYITPFRNDGYIFGNGIVKRLVGTDTIYDYIPKTIDTGLQYIQYNYINSAGCFKNSTSDMYVSNKLPIVKIDITNGSCFWGSQILLSANYKNFPNQFLWTTIPSSTKVDDSSAVAIFSTPTQNTSYILKATNGCGSSYDTLKYFKTLVDTLKATPKQICIGSQTIITASTLNPKGYWQNASTNLRIDSSSNYKCYVTALAVGTGTINFSYNEIGTGCIYSYPINITVTNSTTPPPPTSTIIYCKNQQSSQLTTTGTNPRWFLNNVYQSTPHTPNTTNVGNTTYQVSQTINGCESPRANVIVSVKPLPSKPLIKDTLINYCIGDPNPPHFDSFIVASSIASSNNWYWIDSNGNSLSGFVNTFIPNSQTLSLVQNDSFGCASEPTKPITINVINCRPSCANGNTFTRIDAKGGTITNGNYYGGLYHIRSNVTFAGLTIFDSAEVIVDSGVQITILDETEMKIIGSHFFTCEGMWKGINVGTNASLTIDGKYNGDALRSSSFIEDAVNAISFYVPTYLDLGYTYSLHVNNTIFNRNQTSVNINNVIADANGNIPLAFFVGNSIFTSRNIFFNVGSHQWPTINDFNTPMLGTALPFPLTPLSLSSPYIDNGTYSDIHPKAYLKDGLGLTKPSNGILLNTVGDYDINGDYRGINIGYASNNNTWQNKTIFDNLKVGINALNSNIVVNNCSFQKCEIGVSSIADIAKYSIDVSNVNSNTPSNAFFECFNAISASGMRYVNITNCEIRSVQDVYNTSTQGRWGIVVDGSRFSALNISNNKIYNHTTGIYLNNTNGTYNAELVFNSCGELNINNNIIKATHDSIAPTGGEFVTTAIYLGNEMPQDPNSQGDEHELYCNGNDIKDAYFGISLINWKTKTAIVTNNNIRLATIPNTQPEDVEQYGIGVFAGTPSFVSSVSERNIIQNNWITGANKTYNQTGLLLQETNNTNVECNYVENNKHGFRFVSDNSGTRWYDNYMKHTNNFGMTLDNNGIIGQQGGRVAPKRFCTSNNDWMNDNSVWQLGGSFKTNTQNASDARNSILIVETANQRLNPFQPNYFTALPNIYYLPNNGTITNKTNNGGLDCNRCQLQLDLSTVMRTKADQEIDEAIAEGTIEIPTEDSVQRLYVMQERLFEKLKLEQETNGTIQNPTLNNFVQNNNWGSFDFIYYTGKYLAKRDANTVDLLLGYFPSNNIVDDNYWTYYKWQTEMMANANYKPNLSEVLQMANLCPLTNGSVVYAARNLYNRLSKQIVHFKDECPITESTTRKKPTTKFDATSNKIGKSIIYPNPSNGIINIKLGLDINVTHTIKIIDYLGRILFQKTSNQMIESFEIKDRKGFCIVQIMNNKTGQLETEKVILQ